MTPLISGRTPLTACEGRDRGLGEGSDIRCLGALLRCDLLGGVGDRQISRTLTLKGATPGPRRQTSAGQGLTNISVITETGESWEGRCAGVSRSAKSPETV